MECQKCFPDGVIVFFCLCALAWFLIVVSIGVRGNLISTHVGSGPTLDRPAERISDRKSMMIGLPLEDPVAFLPREYFVYHKSAVIDGRYLVEQPSTSECVRVTMPGRKNLLAAPRREISIGVQAPKQDLAFRTIAETFKVRNLHLF